MGVILRNLGLFGRAVLRGGKRVFGAGKNTNQARKVSNANKVGRGLGQTAVFGASAGFGSSMFFGGKEEIKKFALLFIVLYVIANRK